MRGTGRKAGAQNVELPSQRLEAAAGRPSLRQGQISRVDRNKSGTAKQKDPSRALPGLVKPADKARGDTARRSQKGAELVAGQAPGAKEKRKAAASVQNASNEAGRASTANQQACIVPSAAIRDIHPSRSASAAAAASICTDPKKATRSQPNGKRSAAEAEVDVEVVLDDELDIEPSLPNAALLGKVSSAKDRKHSLEEHEIDWSQTGSQEAPTQDPGKPSVKKTGRP